MRAAQPVESFYNSIENSPLTHCFFYLARVLLPNGHGTNTDVLDSARGVVLDRAV
jgi:hypothetical protein